MRKASAADAVRARDRQTGEAALSDIADPKIPIIEVYRGVGLHDHQDAARLSVVRAAIDHVHDLDDLDRLLAFLENSRNPPEARLFAGAKIEAAFALAAEERRERPDIDLAYVAALTAGLDSQHWRDSTRYGPIFDPDATPRDEPFDSTCAPPPARRPPMRRSASLRAEVLPRTTQ